MKLPSLTHHERVFARSIATQKDAFSNLPSLENAVLCVVHSTTHKTDILWAKIDTARPGSRWCIYLIYKTCVHLSFFGMMGIDAHSRHHNLALSSNTHLSIQCVCHMCWRVNVRPRDCLYYMWPYATFYTCRAHNVASCLAYSMCCVVHGATFDLGFLHLPPLKPLIFSPKCQRKVRDSTARRVVIPLCVYVLLLLGLCGGLGCVWVWLPSTHVAYIITQHIWRISFIFRNNSHYICVYTEFALWRLLIAPLYFFLQRCDRQCVRARMFSVISCIYMLVLLYTKWFLYTAISRSVIARVVLLCATHTYISTMRYALLNIWRAEIDTPPKPNVWRLSIHRNTDMRSWGVLRASPIAAI